MLKYSVYVMAVILCVMCGVLIYFDGPEIPLYQSKEGRPDFQFSEVTISHFNHGVLELQVSANVASIYKSSSELILDHVSGSSVMTGNEVLRFNADKGVYSLDTYDLELMDMYMVYYMEEGTVWFDSKKVIWNPLMQELRSDTLTHVYSDSVRASSTSLIFNLQNKALVLDGLPMVSFSSGEEN